MARSLWKPMYVGRVHKRKLFSVAKRLLRHFRRFKTVLIRKIRKARSLRLKMRLFKKAINANLRGRASRVVLEPKRSDSITRLTTKLSLTSSFAAGTVSDRSMSIHDYNVYDYVVNQNMLTEKIGNFMINRRSGGYRANKDKQKIEKFKKDMAKEMRKQIHQAREHARLMAKALKEDKAAKRAKRRGKK